jgi:hypothetical protein
VFPFPSFEYDFTPGVPNMPLRLVTIVANNYDPFTPIDHMGLKDVAFTFVPDSGAGPMSYAGVMRQDAVNRDGPSVAVPTEYRYKQSFLATAPDDTNITVDDFNASQHGYKRSE